MKLIWHFIPRGRSIRFYLLLSWVVSGLFVLSASIFVFLLFSWNEFSNRQSNLSAKLVEKSVVISRRLSGEMLIGARGSPKAIADYLKDELNLSAVSFGSETPHCRLSSDSSGDFCVVTASGMLEVYRRIPFLSEPVFARITAPSNKFIHSLRPSLLAWSLLPLILLVAIGLYMQRRFLNNHISNPIEALIRTSTGDADPSPHWPKELSDISNKLATSFKEREEAVFGKLSRGVIHDIRTLLHTVLSAADLVDEVADNSPSQNQRLKVLHKACKVNLKKVRDIVDLTLDGSREIPIRKINADLATTISGAVSNNKALADSKGVRVSVNSRLTGAVIAHDPLQVDRVFTNLIKNAIEAFDSESDQYRSKVVCIELKDEKNGISVAVEDSGPGLPCEGGSAFQLLKSSKVHGSGLGLVISKKIVEGHGGKITAGKSEKLRGAKFEVTLYDPSQAESVC